MEFLPAIEPDLDRKTFMKTIKSRIDDRTRELEREAQAEFNLPTLTSRDVEIEEAREKAEAEQQEAKTAIPMKSVDQEKTNS